MKTLEAEIEIGADGSVRLLSPLPAVAEAGPGACSDDRGIGGGEEKPQRRKLTATPEMIARRVTALEEIRKLNPYRDITDPVEWQREMREDDFKYIIDFDLKNPFAIVP